MKRNSRPSARQCRRGATLVEAVAGTALLGTLLVALLVVRARMTVQASRAALRVEACTIADGLLAGWWLDRDTLPRDDAGAVPDRPGWTWRAERVTDDEAAALDAEVVALSVYAPGQPPGLPAARVEILVPIHAQANEPRADSR